MNQRGGEKTMRRLRWQRQRREEILDGDQAERLRRKG